MMNRLHWFWLGLFLLISCDSGPQTRIENPSDSAEIRVVRSEQFWADPAIVQSCEENVVTTMHWNVPGVEKVEVRVGEIEGALFSVSGNEGSKQTDKWVKHGMRFFLINASTRAVIAEANVLIDRSGCD